ncbi:MAG: cobyrinic acid a,c-diamide synthase [Clostridia bacterium]|nr:cobyrinic acid a,c-diamide synthase [Clostridia bacterium]NCC43043.1 cobyrinic acid a,c-diamide synthase [Clostridia bacterium]
MEKENRDTKILAFAGKGGVGKTSLAAVTVKLLTAAYPNKKILAIDADPAVGLSTALGIEVHTTIDDIRKEVVATVEEGNTRSAIELLGEAQYRITDAIEEADGYAFIAIGRPESSGCYCKINSYLKAVIQMISENFDYVVIDGEAGIEQINRRVMEKVTHLLLVSDSSKKGTDVIQTIKQVADELVMYEQVGAVINRMIDLDMKNLIDTGEIPVLSYIGTDKELAAFDMAGQNVLFLPDEAEIVNGMKEALEKMNLL